MPSLRRIQSLNVDWVDPEQITCLASWRELRDPALSKPTAVNPHRLACGSSS
ncbi:MAG: hypothetical protein JWP31_974 [Aeromicrobium sp.]|nr:hypothetical protein [Aeromicrobium sp.]